MIKSIMTILAIFILCAGQTARKKILVFAKTAGFYHQSIPEGMAALMKLGEENRIAVDTTRDASVFNLNNLKKYHAVVFLNTTGNVLNEEQQKAFEAYVGSGGGFVGIHSAADTEYDWPWYGKLVGAYFQSHPAVQEASLDVVDRKHPSTRHLASRWTRKDEWYNYKSISDKLSILITIDESSYSGRKMDAFHPISWCQSYSGGRAFYTGLGHTKESFTQDQDFLKHILGGIRYAMK